jgi:hypothetical protein
MTTSPWCGYSSSYLGRCCCGDSANHDPGGRFYKEGRLPDTVYPRPAPCHPERCIAMSPDVQVVSESTFDTLVVECDKCATVVGTHSHDQAQAAAQTARQHITTHHPSQTCDTEKEGKTMGTVHTLPTARRVPPAGDSTPQQWADREAQRTHGITRPASHLHVRDVLISASLLLSNSTSADYDSAIVDLVCAALGVVNIEQRDGVEALLREIEPS